MIKTLWPINISSTNKDFGVIQDHWPANWQQQWQLGQWYPELKNYVNQQVNLYWQECGFQDAELDEIMVWYNYLGLPGSHIKPHTHGVALVGWCYYIATPPGSGALAFMNPAGSTSWDIMYHPAHPGRSDKYEYVWRHEPKAGDLLVFPSWLSHYVEPGNTETPRISVAGEFHLKRFAQLPKV
jgi:uncharacterized protein (TIGR02466 family)